ncbi:MAG: UDP-N-acetylmuramate dehydrogenase [Fimbriimonadales bacterium]
MDKSISLLREHVQNEALFRDSVTLSQYSTLQAGGRASWVVEVSNLDLFAKVAAWCQETGVPHLVLGSGSNILVSDRGYRGLVIVNKCSGISHQRQVHAECGCWFQDLFLFAAQRCLAGLEFAVGIPGTLGGALVSNAGAYRSNISDLLVSVEIVESGERRWVAPDYLQFSYRNSILRSSSPPRIVLLSVLLELQRGDSKAIYDRAREFQRQRISKQPPHASAGSFFKNVYDATVAQSLDGLPENLKDAGLIPAGYLIEACGLKRSRVGNAVISERHANFICNLGGASASDIRRLAETVKDAVKDKFGVVLEEEVLYVGDWAN